MHCDWTFLVRASAVVVPGALLMALHAASAATPQATPDTPAGLEKLSRRRIFFGHQSVGANLLEGMGRLMSRGGPAPQVREVREPTAAVAPGTLAHAMLGHNEQPESKLADFERYMDGGMAAQTDVALLKFCYIDFNVHTDARALFARYRATLDGLKARHPQVTFVHVTVPLTTVQSGAKAWLKELMGRSVWGVGENVTREAFNALMRQTYAGKEPLFDLATLESTRPDGTPETYTLNGRAYPAMVAAYSNDGGHLNEVGQARLATAFIDFLAALPPATRTSPAQAVP
ncbi:hypothetical protein KRR26_30545 [Corallococcus sp. M34]|nr:hypothetical protein [Citreicoccus inhibens]